MRRAKRINKPRKTNEHLKPEQKPRAINRTEKEIEGFFSNNF